LVTFWLIHLAQTLEIDVYLCSTRDGKGAPSGLKGIVDKLGKVGLNHDGKEMKNQVLP
jgi:hypothetical protein